MRSSAESSKTFLATLPVVLLLPALGGAIWVFSPNGYTRFSPAAAFAVFATLALGGFFALTRRALPRAGVSAAVSLSLWSLVIAYFAMDRLTTSIVYGETGHFCGTGSAMLLGLVVPLGFLAVIGLSLALVLLMAERQIDRAVRPAARVATAMGLIALAFAAPKWRKPEPDQYLDSLPVNATLKEGDRFVVGGREIHYVGEDVPPYAPANVEEDAPPASRPYESPAARTCKLEGVTGYNGTVSITTVAGKEPCPGVQVRVDPAGDYAFAGEVYGPSANEGSWRPWGGRVAFRPAEGTSLDFKAAMIADRLSAPIGWRIGALVCVTFACGFLAVAVRIRRRARPGQEALHNGEGWCAITGEEGPVRIPAAASLPIGPVMLYGAAEATATYREKGGRIFSEARAGTVHTQTDVAATFEALALAAALLGSTPLLIARCFGI